MSEASVPVDSVNRVNLSPAARALFVLTIFAGSFLLFLVQPMVARMALPRLGGAPAVWNSAMVVYQALLLGGYAYAHALGRLRPRVQAGVHLGVLLVAALWLPIGLLGWRLPPTAEPVLWVPALLAASIGPLFLAVSAQAPLVQRWYALASGGEDPYRLYAASNLGSFGGLLAYPVLVEPALALRGQSLLWTGGYALLILLVAAAAFALPRAATVETVGAISPAPSRARVLRWIALALVPSGLMLATSTYITTDIVAMPLVWVLPLGLYLLSFSVAFAANRWLADLITQVAPITVLLFGGVMIGGYNEMPYFNVALALALLFVVSVALHTALYRDRPDPDRLTGFYLATSVGGALGGVFAGLVAPVVFDWTWEYPLLILAAGALTPQLFLTAGLKRVWRGEGAPAARIALAAALVGLFLLRLYGPADLFGEGRQGAAFLILAAIGLTTLGARGPFLAVLAASVLLFGGYRGLALSWQGDVRTRSYFGVYTITDQPGQRMLAHGTTVHGIQLRGSPARERTPTTYYAPGGGVGQAMTAAPALYGPAARIGVVGLGTGTLACYAKPRQRWRIYEIDPAMVRLARDSGKFTFLRDCLPQPEIVLGDARLSLAADPAASLDLLALDAFSSDAVPMHLLTREAFETYGRVVQRDGLLLVHISNRFFDLEPVVSAAAIDGGWRGMILDYNPSDLDREHGASLSTWIALSRNRAVLRTLAKSDGDWRELPRYPGFESWTDDYGTVLPLLKGF
jgi:SAM-dependent methyltransferase